MTTTIHLAPSIARRAVLSRRIRLFAAATIAYNVVEAVAALWAGNVADSSALIGFGLDSVIEVASALALSWQFSAKDPERREHLTLRIIAVSFFALAAFVTVDSIRSLTGGGEAQHSTPGIVIAALSLAIMPVLSWLQRRAGRELGSRTAVADSKQTLLCTYLSAVLLVGLVLNSALGWWWADAGAALIIAAIAVREGTNAWKGDVCCTVAHTAADNDADADDCCSASATGTGATAKDRTSSATKAAPVKEPAPAPAAAEETCCEGCGSAGGPQAVSSGLSRRNDEASEHRA
jgi:Co/Zn/Cd efflux system component